MLNYSQGGRFLSVLPYLKGCDLMLKEFKRYSSFNRALINELYSMRELGSGFVATYTISNKLIYICISDSRFILYFQNKIYFVCSLESIDILCFEISKIFIKYGTNLILSTSF